MHSPSSKVNAIDYAEKYGIKKAAHDLDVSIKSLKRWQQGKFQPYMFNFDSRC
jgi:hypothetical protein